MVCHCDRQLAKACEEQLHGVLLDEGSSSLDVLLQEALNHDVRGLDHVAAHAQVDETEHDGSLVVSVAELVALLDVPVAVPEVFAAVLVV